MALNVNLDYATVIGTPPQVIAFMGLLKGQSATNVSMVGANVVLLDKPLSREELATAIERTPRKQMA